MTPTLTCVVPVSLVAAPDEPDEPQAAAAVTRAAVTREAMKRRMGPPEARRHLSACCVRAANVGSYREHMAWPGSRQRPLSIFLRRWCDALPGGHRRRRSGRAGPRPAPGTRGRRDR